jgi:hypothetical protein
MENPNTNNAAGISISAHIRLGILFSDKSHHVFICWPGCISDKDNQEHGTVIQIKTTLFIYPLNHFSAYLFTCP